jgi:DNA-binding winged helix-turn-helix (wHTH) protein/TolB-like protein/Flp pilus assembly protein TadD
MSGLGERYAFGSFVLDASERRLLEGDVPISLRDKVFETLLFLVRNAGRLVTKEELMAAIWPEATVEESGLTHNISVLRTAINQRGADPQLIETVPKRGYRFVGKVIQLAGTPRAESLAPAVPPERFRSAAVPPQPGIPRLESGLWPRFHAPADYLRNHRFLGFGVAALMVIGLACIGVLTNRPPASGMEQIRSVAVLPFQPLDRSQHADFFGIGLADAVIDRLGYTHRFVVRPTSSVRRYADSPKDAVAAGKDLDVDAVVEGGIQTDGRRVRVSVQVVSVSQKAPIWSAKFDEDSRDRFALEDLISGAVARALTDSAPAAAPETRRPPSADAYETVMKARYYWNQRNPADLQKARALFEQAIREDRSYAQAYAGLADTYILLSLHRQVPPDEAFPRAKAATQRALECEPNLAQAHAALGACSFYYDRDRLNAERQFRRALELQPSYATARQWYANYLTATGRFDEAIEQMTRAQQVDPLSMMVRAATGWHLFLARRYDEAASQLRKTLDLESDFVPALHSLALVDEQKHAYAEAMQLLEKEERLSGEPALSLSEVARLQVLSGDRAAAARSLASVRELVARQKIMAYDLATVYAAMGDSHNAVSALQDAIDRREPAIVWLAVDPRLDSIRGVKAFKELMARHAW